MTCDHEAQIRDLLEERDALAAAVDRVRLRHPRGDEESDLLAPGKWCPTCGRERSDKGYGGCPDRRALSITTEETEIRRLRMGNHPAGRARGYGRLMRRLGDGDALAEALTERDAEHEGGGGA